MTVGQTHTVGQLLDRAITITVRNSPMLLLIGAVGVVPASVVKLLDSVAARHTAADPGQGLLVSLTMLVAWLIVLLVSLVSWLAVGVAVDAISRGEEPTAMGALRESLGALKGTIAVGLRYAPALMFFGGITLACFAGIASGTPGFVLLAALACIAVLIPYSLTVSGATVAMFHRLLRPHHPGSEHFEGGSFATSWTTRNVLAALCGVGISYAGFYAVQVAFFFGMRWFQVPTYALDAAQFVVLLISTELSAAFYTLFYQDLLAESAGVDLMRDAVRLREERRASAAP